MGSSRHEQVIGHLPLEINTMVGRRQETANIRSLMGSHRLVTLTGPGGIGKTRTALHVARSLRRTFSDGVWFVELDPVPDPALVTQVVLETLKVPDTSARDPRAVLTDYLVGRQVLLVLDNCEHLLAETALLVEALLREVGGVHVLATSRQPLDVPGEATYRIDPLAIPDDADAAEPADVAGFAAVELFATRARTALGAFEVDAANHRDVVRLCTKLEGLPLALELAASRLKVMTISEMLGRLDDRFGLLKATSHVAAPRHQTLLAAVTWSHDLCSTAEQMLWRRASVFAGSFSLEAAETVCAGGELPRGEVLDALLGLVDKSIVVNEPQDGRMRFRMLGTLRDFGAERLAEAGETEALLAAHCAWTSAWVDDVASDWVGPRQAELIRELRMEQANIRGALDFCATRAGYARTGLQLAGAVWFHWAVRGLSEGRLWLERLLAVDPQPSTERALALGTAGYVAAIQGDIEHAAQSAVACEKLALDLGDPVLTAYGVHMQALCAFFSGDAPAAEALFARSRTLYAGADSPPAWRLMLDVHYATMHALQGDVEVAASIFRAVETTCEQYGEQWLRARGVWGVGLASFHAGDLNQAEALLLHSIELKSPFLDHLGLALDLDVLAWVLAAKGEGVRAARLVGAASALWSTFGLELFGSEFFTAKRAQCEASVRKKLGVPAYDEAVRRGAAATLDHTLRELLDHEPARPAAARRPDSVLTRREKEVARLVAEGLTNREIADRLVISTRTAEAHVENVLRKLDFRSRTQIATWFAGPGDDAV